MRRELMESKNGIESALANLIQLSSEKGFLVFDDIYDEADKWALSIRDVDYLSSFIVTRGILARSVASQSLFHPYFFGRFFGQSYASTGKVSR